jgi:ribosomal protein S2
VKKELTKEEQKLLSDTKARLKRSWAGVGDYSTVEGLVQIIDCLRK